MNDYLTKEEIKQVFKDLAKSQGFYGRLLEEIETNHDADAVYQRLEDEHFESPIDLIMVIEGVA